jgi:RNA polymerase sigma factor (sigma-70 family)
MTFEEFVIKYARLIEKLSYKFKLNGYSVDDIRQEIYMIAMRVVRYHKEGNATLTNYFIKSVYRDMVRLIRNQPRIHAIELEDVDRLSVFGIEDTTIQDLERELYLEEIWDYIDTQPLSYRARWYYKAHMTHKRIAEIEGVSTQAIGIYLRKLNKRVKENFPNFQDYI